jgi:hypothetical protein
MDRYSSIDAFFGNPDWKLVEARLLNRVCHTTVCNADVGATPLPLQLSPPVNRMARRLLSQPS